MKKIYFLLIALVAGSGAFAQTVANAGMETWRSGVSGASPAVTVYAPTQWYGFDSLVIATEEQLLPLFLMYTPTNLHAQLFQESTIVHGGSSSAKLITLKQDTLGLFAGILSNAQPNLNTGTLIATMSVAQSLTFSGGTPVTGKVATVSAWVQYKAGVDSAGAPAADTGEFVVSVYSQVHGIDSAVGTATVVIPPTGGSWTQITATVVYNDSVDIPDTVRMQFASSGQTNPRDSSTLYVDDVTMVYAPPSTSVNNVIAGNSVKIYPNPASGMLYIDGQESAGSAFTLFSVNGQVVATKALTGKDDVDVSVLPDGLYFYTISGTNGSVQRGKVSVVR